MTQGANMWNYRQPTEILFGVGSRESLSEAAAEFGARPMLVTDATLADLPMVEETRQMLGPNVETFSDVEPNPTVGSVDSLAQRIGEHASDVVVAIGGGSSLDCAKAACSVALQGGPTRRYHSEGQVLDDRHLPLIVLPTTAGTGSEVTPISVLGDPEKDVKAPLAHANFFPKLAIIDPELTLTMPRQVTASTGLDALAHAIEGYWSKGHQPICDLFALRAVALVFKHFPNALEDGRNLDAREGMSMAALLGGLAFQMPKNAAVHACSFPLSNSYHLPHGTACAMTLDHFIRFNGPAMGDRGRELAGAAGLDDMDALADAVGAMKADAGLPTRLSEIGVREEDLEELVEASFHPLMDNNPREVTASELGAMYRGML